MTKDNTPLFFINLDKGFMWELYLDSFPEGTNERKKEIKAENQKIMSIIAMKEDEELHNMSIEQLKARLK